MSIVESFVNINSSSSRRSSSKNNHNNETEYDENSIINTDALNIPYTVCEILVAIVAIIGNAMVVIVFLREKKLRRRTNYYIVSLAIADMLVGLLGVPFAILASIGLPKHTTVCLLTISLLVVLCTISIFCLVAVSVDRYWAILYPLAYSKNVRTKTTLVIIAFCWAFGSIIGFLPSFGWNQSKYECEPCLFEKVMDYNYLLFLYFGTIITPAVLMIGFYIHIYTVVIKQVTQVVTIDQIGGANLSRKASLAPATFTKMQRTSSMPAARSTSISVAKPASGKMLRVLGAARKREVKAAQNLSIIVFFFLLCWIPLYTINFVNAFCKTCSIPALTYFCIILSHLNSALNPLLYAYHLKDFRAALKYFILKLFGKEIHSQESSYKYSLASQAPHRLQSIFEKRMSLQPRVYVDSPVYLRQQELKKRNSMMLITGTTTMNFENVQNSVSPKLGCGGGIHHNNNNSKTKSFSTSVMPHRLHQKTSNSDREIWNILEIPSGTKENSSIFDDIKSIASSIDETIIINNNNNNNELENNSEIFTRQLFKSNDLSYADEDNENDVNNYNVQIINDGECQEKSNNIIQVIQSKSERRADKRICSNSVSQIFHIQSEQFNNFSDYQCHNNKNISRYHECQQSSVSLNITDNHLNSHIEICGGDDDDDGSNLNQPPQHSSTNEMITARMSSIGRPLKQSRSKSITNFDLPNNDHKRNLNNCLSCELVFNNNNNNNNSNNNNNNNHNYNNRNSNNNNNNHKSRSLKLNVSNFRIFKSVKKDEDKIN